jgi:hypothetical protein
MKGQLAAIFVLSLLLGCATRPTSTISHSPLNNESDIAIRFAGGDGSSPKMAIVLVGANSEWAGIGGETLWAKVYLPGWEKTGQELLASGRKSYDAITYRSADGKTRKVFFNISSYFGKF